MNTSKKKQNTMNRYRVIEENLVGQYKDNSINYDLLNIITIGLGKVEETEPKTILNMLDTLLYSNKPPEEKRDILKNVYDVVISNSIIEEINTMCNLGEGLYEKAYNQAYNQAVADEQAKQAIAMQKLLEEKTKALLDAGVSQDIIDKIMKSN